MKSIEVCDIAKWFFDKNESCRMRTFDGNAKLQKLVYYTQAMYSALYDKPLFTDRIEAWENGPVVRKIYNHKNNNRFESMEKPAFNSETERVLKVVNSVYGSLTTNELIELTHDETPWKELEGQAKKRWNPEIKFETINDFYKDLRDVYDAFEDYDFESEVVETINNNNFSYNKNDIQLSEDDFYELHKLGQIEKNKSFNVLKNEDGSLVVY